ncbi:MAG: hypothetical protein PHS04_11655 [Tissierellia bacterium]|nr:hypothetical protein [Tissierellia bacterium]
MTELERINNYPLNRDKDLEMYKTLEERYPDIDLIATVKDWRINKINQPLELNSNARSQLNTWCKNDQEWGKNKKPDKPKDAIETERQKALLESVVGFGKVVS